MPLLRYRTQLINRDDPLPPDATRQYARADLIRVLTGIAVVLAVMALFVSTPLMADVTAQRPPPERVIWDSSPIRVLLPVGKERLVQFPAEALDVGIPDGLRGSLRTISNDGIVYWQARDAFETRRVVLQDRVTGRHFLVDLEAREGAADTRLVIMLPGERQDPDNAVATRPDHQNLDFVKLTRFAAQQMYAPSRLRPYATDLHRVPLHREPVNLLRGGAVEALPMISWRGGPYHVTVVRLTSRVNRAVDLDPRNLRGNWLAATFQHNRLHPAGSEADTTAVYLISRRPFEESL